MTAWEIVIFILIVLALGGLWYFLHVSESKTKDKHKMAAYTLLEQKNPDPQKIKETIKMLRLYAGRFTKDQEFGQLEVMLADLLQEIEGSGKAGYQVKE